MIDDLPFDEPTCEQEECRHNRRGECYLRSDPANCADFENKCLKPCSRCKYKCEEYYEFNN